jgi:hypothetical protein
MRWERDWIEVPISEVVVDDLLANHASVTESRPCTSKDGPFSARVKPEWMIRCGPSFASFGERSRRVVVGRNPRRVKS